MKTNIEDLIKVNLSDLTQEQFLEVSDYFKKLANEAIQKEYEEFYQDVFIKHKYNKSVLKNPDKRQLFLQKFNKYFNPSYAYAYKETNNVCPSADSVVSSLYSSRLDIYINTSEISNYSSELVVVNIEETDIYLATEYEYPSYHDMRVNALPTKWFLIEVEEKTVLTLL